MAHLTDFFAFDNLTKQKITRRVAEELFSYAADYLPTGLIYGLVIAGVYYLLCTGIYLLCHRLVRKDKPAFRQWSSRFLRGSIFLCILVAYVYVTLGISILCRAPGSRQEMNLTLFSSFKPNLQDRIYVVENVLMFVPLGILLPLVWKPLYRFPWCVMIGMAGSIAIEVVQYRLARGFTQIDDVLNNTLGTLLGYWMVLACHVCLVLWRRWRQGRKHQKVRDRQEMSGV